MSVKKTYFLEISKMQKWGIYLLSLLYNKLDMEVGEGTAGQELSSSTWEKHRADKGFPGGSMG